MASGQWRGSTRSARLPRSWHATRARVLRDHYGICHVCKGPGADAVDHVVHGDDHAEENLRPIHDKVWPHCHRTKSAREGAGASATARRARVAARYRRPEAHPGEVG